MKPISIITASFNDASGLNELANALTKQDRKLFEWIVVDGASSDNAIEVAQSHSDLIDIFISEPDSGVYDAWNKGLAKANGQWVVFLGCDDRLGDGWLEQVAKASCEYDLVYGDLVLLSQDRRKYRIKRFPVWSDARTLLSQQMCLPHSGMAHNHRLFSAQQFDSCYRICGDWEFLVRSKPQSGLHVSDFVQTIMSLGGLSSSAKSELRMYHEIQRIQRAQKLKIAWGWRLKFYIRICLSMLPRLYNWVQALGMRPWLGTA